MKTHFTGRWTGYAKAIAAILIAVLVRGILIPFIGLSTPYLTVFPVLLFVSLLCGLGPSLAASLVGIFAAEYWLIDPVGQIDLTWAGAGRVLLVLALSALLGYVGDRLRKAQRSAMDQESAFRESEERRKLAQQAGRVAVFDWNLRTNEASWSNDLEAVLGLPPGTLPPNYDGWRSSAHPDDLARLEPFLQDLFQSDRTEAEWEFRIEIPSGGYWWLQTRARIMRDEKGQAYRVIGTNLDITERKKTEEMLREREFRLRAFVESNAIGILFGDAEGQIFDCNEELARIIGRTREEAKSGSVKWTEITPAEDLVLDEQALDEARNTGKCAPYEKHFIRPDGARVPVVLGFNLLEPDRKKSVAFILDISDRVRMERALRESEERLGKAMNASPFPVMIYADDGEILSVNAAFTKLSGYRIEDISTMKEWYKKAYGEEKPETVYMDGISGLESIVSEGEEMIRTSDGNQRIWDFYSGSIGNDARGRRLVISTAVDVTERRQSEEEFRETSTRLHSILENAPTPIYLKDREGRYLLLNEAWENATGIPAGSAAAHTDLEILDKETAEDLQRNDRLVLEQQRVLTVEEKVPRGEEVRTYKSLKFPFRGPDGTVEGVCGISTDVTEQIRAEQALREGEDRFRTLAESERAARGEAERANALKDEFLATVSHELRTPLNAILGWAQLLSRKRVEPEKAVPIIEQNARAQAQLIEDLLDMSRIVSGKLRVEAQTVRMDDIVWAAANAVRPAAEEKAIGLDFSIEGEQSTVQGDPARLQQVVWNLLSNAVKFTGKGGHIGVSLRSRGERVEVKVVDTGEGISKEFLEHIFDPFRQADASTTRGHRGLGIGLAIARHIADLHGGTIRAESRGKGYGSTFVFTLPAHSDDKAQFRPPGEQHYVDAIIPEGLTILVIDDEPQAVELLKHLLSERGAYVWSAASAREALGILERERPDVILSDIGMPEMDGYSFIKLVKSYPDERSRIPAIALTAFARGEDRARALDAGYAAHVTKPIDPVVLLTAMSDVMSKTAESLPPREAHMTFDA